MLTMMQFAFVALIAISCTLYEAVGQVSVNGVIVDSTGRPMAHAFVEAIPRASNGGKGTVGSRLNPWSPADAQGRFTISVPPGRYKIRAKDEADGYPDPVYWLNADPTAVFPEITVEQESISDVRVVLGKKGGILEGSLRDSATQLPIPKAKITIREAGKPEAFVEVFTDGAGNFEYTVPSKPIQIVATASGYSPTYYGNGAALILSGGEHRAVTIELSRE